MPATAATLALSPSILAIAAAAGSPPSPSPPLKRKLPPAHPVHFSPSLASYTQRLFHARRPPPPPAAGAEYSPTATTMPRPNPPPTPGSSSDIRGKEGAHAAGLATFNLPPTAYLDERDRNSSTPSNNGSDSSYRPISPALPGKRPAGAVIGKEDFELPPPPTRSRKIIQMKPQEDAPVEAEAVVAASQHSGKPQAGGKRKQGAGTTAAGRKIARKTAHSLIERRRRSKMNEEFDTLKNMIPACKGQEMHKLAILQASIDYLRYLEKCVSDLQQNSSNPSSQRQPPQEPARPPQQGTVEEEDEDDEEEDEEMEDEPPAQPQSAVPSAVSTPAFNPQDKRDSQISLPSLSTITTTSPSIFSHTAGRHYSISSASQASYSPYFHSAHTSPAFGPQLSHHASVFPSSNGGHAFGIGSPALKPQDQASLRQIAEGASAELSLARPATNGMDRSRRSEHELDQEAAGGLLMLNNDRRSWQQKDREKAAGAGGGQGRIGGAAGMSVKDLLTG